MTDEEKIYKILARGLLDIVSLPMKEGQAKCLIWQIRFTMFHIN